MHWWFITRNMAKCIYRYVNLFTTNVAPNMFRPPIVAIFGEVFFEGECQYNLIDKYKMLSFKYMLTLYIKLI